MMENKKFNSSTIENLFLEGIHSWLSVTTADLFFLFWGGIACGELSRITHGWILINDEILQFLPSKFQDLIRILAALFSGKCCHQISCVGQILSAVNHKSLGFLKNGIFKKRPFSVFSSKKRPLTENGFL